MDGPGRFLSRLGRRGTSVGRVAGAGAALGAGLAAFGFAVGTVIRARVGLGAAAELVAAVALAALALALLGSSAAVVHAILRRLPALLAAGLLAPFALVAAVLWALDSGVAVSAWLAGALTLLGAGLGSAVALVARRPRGMDRRRRAAAWAWLALSVGVALALVAWLWGPGVDRDPPVESLASRSTAPAIAAPDPSLRGPSEVRALTYGSGTDRRRPEYGAQAALRTASVDASRLVKNLTGVKAWVRAWYWGFGLTRLPLNGRVWYPHGDGPFPLVLIVHGNHQMEDHADAGYAYLGEMLASRGFIAVSVDENFLNRSWSGDLGHEHGARGWLLLHHLAAWRAWNDTPGNPFHRRVDMERIALIGHSRGGEAVAHAAAFNRLPCLPDDCTVTFDFHFAIRALVAIAPTDGGYLPASQPVPIEDVSYLVLHGSHDGDVANFQGLRAYRRAKVAGDAYRFKAAVIVGGANHARFSTGLGTSDLRGPFRSLALTPPLAGEDQRRIARVLIGGFLEAALNGQHRYVSMFRDLGAAAAWLPRTAYVSQFEDSTYRLVTDFSGDIDLGRGTLPGSRQAGRHLTVWREGPFKGRGDWPFQVRVLYLGWKGGQGEPAGYRITLPDGAAARFGLDPESRLVIVAADAREQRAETPVDFTIEVATSDGAVARVPLSLPPVPRVRFTKWAYLDRRFFFDEAEPALSTSEIPLRALAAPGWQPSRIREVRLVFDRAPSGTIVLASVGFSGSGAR